MLRAPVPVRARAVSAARRPGEGVRTHWGPGGQDPGPCAGGGGVRADAARALAPAMAAISRNKPQYLQ